jgi:hypothetical protein
MARNCYEWKAVAESLDISKATRPPELKLMEMDGSLYPT